jgi:hypothetical protein
MSCWATRALYLRRSSTTPTYSAAWDPFHLTGCRNPASLSFLSRTVTSTTSTVVAVQASLLSLLAGSNKHDGGGGRAVRNSSSERALAVRLPQQQYQAKLLVQRRHVFSFAGPRRLQDLLDTEKVVDAPGSLVAELWETYHANQVTHECVYKMGKLILFTIKSRTRFCPTYLLVPC